MRFKKLKFILQKIRKREKRSISSTTSYERMSILRFAITSKGNPESNALKQKMRTYLEDFELDRKSTRLNSSHVKISYAVFCLKKKRKVVETPIKTRAR